MPTFAEILEALPSIDTIARLELIAADGSCVAAIENQPGKQGSLKVYNKVIEDHGKLDKSGAEQALGLFAEHVADAEAHPGKHPNIDRLFDIIAQNLHYEANIIHR